MFFIISKVFSFLISPLNWIVILFAIGIFSKKTSRKKKCLLTAFTLLVIFTNPFILNVVMRWWELPTTNIYSISKTYDAGIMLGGTIRYYNSEVDRPVFGQGADRYMQSLELLASKKVKQIIFSSGSGSMLYKDAKEADFLKAQMLRIGIDSNLVIAENKSRNTFENAKETAYLINQKKIKGPFLLITSAFHMRRSLACFKKQGVDVIPFAVDQRSGAVIFTPDKLFIPDTEKLMDWDLLFHEWLGFVSYKMAGYV